MSKDKDTKEKNNSPKNKTLYGEFTLDYWIRQILTRNLILPKYQRSFVWKKEQVIGLANSFYKDYFIPPITIGHINGQNIIIDGQQRLTSILLSYLGVMPSKKFIAVVGELDATYDEEDDTDSQYDDNLTKYYKWSLSSFLDKVKSLDELRKEVNNSEDYDKIETDWFDDEFIGNHYLGFSYIVPKDKKDTVSNHKFFSTVFRQVNISGTPLLKIESRRSLYFLNEKFQHLFEPEFLQHINISVLNAEPQPIDFVRTLALLFEYSKNENFRDVLRGMKPRTEEYYELFIDHCINFKDYETLREGESQPRSDKSRFKKFSSVFKNGKYEEALTNLKAQFSKINLPNSFPSIIDFDIYFFGLIYWTFILQRELVITEENKNKLNNRFKNKIKEFKGDPRHVKSPGGLKYIRKRMEESIEIYAGIITFPHLPSAPFVNPQ